jgi:hypothetical protein
MQEIQHEYDAVMWVAPGTPEEKEKKRKGRECCERYLYSLSSKASTLA